MLALIYNRIEYEKASVYNDGGFRYVYVRQNVSSVWRMISNPKRKFDAPIEIRLDTAISNRALGGRSYYADHRAILTPNMHRYTLRLHTECNKSTLCYIGVFPQPLIRRCLSVFPNDLRLTCVYATLYMLVFVRLR